MWNKAENNGFAGSPWREPAGPVRPKWRSWLLYVRIRLRGVKPPLNLLIPLALFIPHQLMLAWDGMLALFPGAWGRRVRLGADTIHAMLLQLVYAEPQNIADIKFSDKKQDLRVLIRTVGLSGGDDL